MWQQRGLREIQVQTDIDTVRIQRPQPRRRLVGPGRGADQAADRVHAALRRQGQRGVVDAAVQAEVVNADADRAAMLARTMHDPAARRHVALFIAVGCVAAAVHWAVVVGLVGGRGWQPLVANVFGWLVAFAVSLAGHHRLTFRGHGAPLRAVSMRFFVVSAGGFAVNEASYALLLGWTAQRYDLLLAAVLLAVAAVTYLLNRHWAFLRTAAN